MYKVKGSIRRVWCCGWSFLLASVFWESCYKVKKKIGHSTIKYLEALEEELSSMPSYKEPENVEREKECLKSQTEPKCGIRTGVSCYPANRQESNIILKHLKEQPCSYKKIALDGEYDIGAVHRSLELLDINGYTDIDIEFAFLKVP